MDSTYLEGWRYVELRHGGMWLPVGSRLSQEDFVFVFFFVFVFVSVLVITFLGVGMVLDKDVEGWRYAE